MLMKRQELLRCKLQCRKSEDRTRRGNTQSELCDLSLRKFIGCLRQRNLGFTRYSLGHYSAAGGHVREISRGIAPGAALRKQLKHRAKSYDCHYASHSSLALYLNEFPFRGVQQFISVELSKWKARRPRRRRSTFLD